MVEFDAQTNWWDDLPEAAKDLINRGLEMWTKGKWPIIKK